MIDITKVLIVDDAAFMRLSIKTMLEKNRYEVIGEAVNGTMAIKMFNECHPDVVTLDISMPEMNGVEVLKKIREVDPKAKVVMVSAMGQESIVREAVMCGAKYFLVKPFTEAKLIKTLNKIIGM